MIQLLPPLYAPLIPNSFLREDCGAQRSKFYFASSKGHFVRNVNSIEILGKYGSKVRIVREEKKQNSSIKERFCLFFISRPLFLCQAKYGLQLPWDYQVSCYWPNKPQAHASFPRAARKSTNNSVGKNVEVFSQPDETKSIISLTEKVHLLRSF